MNFQQSIAKISTNSGYKQNVQIANSGVGTLVAKNTRPAWFGICCSRVQSLEPSDFPDT
jgi:hypothetical protein